MLYLQIASPKSSVLNFLDSNSFEVIISIFQRTEKVPDMERLRLITVLVKSSLLSSSYQIKQLYMELYKTENIEKFRSIIISIERNAAA